jgi:hypothetical protein
MKAFDFAGHRACFVEAQHAAIVVEEHVKVHQEVFAEDALDTSVSGSQLAEILNDGNYTRGGMVVYPDLVQVRVCSSSGGATPETPVSPSR